MTKNDISKIDVILQVIARDEELCEQFAQAIGETEEDFGDWLDKLIPDKNTSH